MADINFLVGGAAGQGIQTVGIVLAKTMARAGLYVFADQDYESRVRGGHNAFRIRAGDSEILAVSFKLDILIAVDQKTVELHYDEMKSDGTVIYDRDKLNLENKKLNLLGIPLEHLAEQATSNKLMANTVAVGAAIAVAGYDFELLAHVLRAYFIHIGEDIAEANVKAAQAGYEHAVNQGAEFCHSPIKSTKSMKQMMLLNGNEALALGAMAAGCKFVAAYPMTPTTSIMEYMADKGREFNIVVVQPEDEIAAINMAVGAGYAGVRAMTVTSGDGFALMTESFGLAGITETPVVIVLGQRPGPGVGLPTRTEQSELGFAIYGGSGEFPRAVLTPATIGDVYYRTIHAFNLAEKYQIPVVIMTDEHLASSYQTVEKFNLQDIKIERGQLLSEEESNRAVDYKRYQFMENGVSPRAIPMQGKALVVSDSDEHDEAGHMIEDAALRTRMMQKRMRKYNGISSEISKPFFDAESGAEMNLIGWGSTFGAISEAKDILTTEGIKANMIHLDEVWPFPVQDMVSFLSKAGKNVVIENNATGQLAHIISAETGIKVSHMILKYDGRPFSPEYIVRELKKGVI